MNLKQLNLRISCPTIIFCLSYEKSEIEPAPQQELASCNHLDRYAKHSDEIIHWHLFIFLIMKPFRFRWISIFLWWKFYWLIFHKKTKVCFSVLMPTSVQNLVRSKANNQQHTCLNFDLSAARLRNNFLQRNCDYSSTESSISVNQNHKK